MQRTYCVAFLHFVSSVSKTLVTNNYLFAVVLLVSVCSLVCPNCGLVVLFDGLSCGLLNMGRYLVGHDVLRMYMHSFLGGKLVLIYCADCFDKICVND
jgi:hypothetical protein